MKNSKNTAANQPKDKTSTTHSTTQSSPVNYFGAGTCKEDFLW